jgi:hypothetical protein
MSWKMFELLVFPAIGMTVCSGFAGANEAISAPNGAGLVFARNGGMPVGVGPVGVSCWTQRRQGLQC